MVLLRALPLLPKLQLLLLLKLKTNPAYVMKFGEIDGFSWILTKIDINLKFFMKTNMTQNCILQVTLPPIFVNFRQKTSKMVDFSEGRIAYAGS